MCVACAGGAALGAFLLIANYLSDVKAVKSTVLVSVASYMCGVFAMLYASALKESNRNERITFPEQEAMFAISLAAIALWVVYQQHAAAAVRDNDKQRK